MLSPQDVVRLGQRLVEEVKEGTSWLSRMVSIFGFRLNGVCSVATLLRAVEWFGVWVSSVRLFLYFVLKSCRSSAEGSRKN